MAGLGSWLAEINLMVWIASIETTLRDSLTVLKPQKETLRPKTDIKQKCEKSSLLWFEQIEPSLNDFQIEKSKIH